VVRNGKKQADSAPSAVVAAPNGGTAPARILHNRLEHLTIELIPDRIASELVALPARTAADRLDALWHEVRKPAGIVVEITSADERHRILRLSAESDDRTWQGRWVRWNYTSRKTPELLGGDAVDAQDILDPNGAKLKLLIAPGETRRATLEICTFLDGESVAGDYVFDVVAEDVTDGEDVAEVDATTRSAILRVRHPHSKLLDSLPSIYREAVTSDEVPQFGYREPEFFERFLLGFEDFTSRLERILGQLDKLFGAYTTPPDFLLWLAAWVCMPLDENWDEMRRRHLIREAVELYRWRGTRRGLSRYLQIYTGVVPEINDQPFHGMRLGPQAKLGTDATILGDVPEHTFVVTLTLPEDSNADEAAIHRIIRYEKPANTAYTLNIVRRSVGAA
jgi:phage tail-like protein